MDKEKNLPELAQETEKSNLPALELADMMAPLMSALAASLSSIQETQLQLVDRLASMEEQIRMSSPVTSKQVSYINAAVKQRSSELLEKREVTGVKYIKKLGNAIRKSVLMRYGVSSLRDLPKCEYQTVMTQIETWNVASAVREVVSKAREEE